MVWTPEYISIDAHIIRITSLTKPRTIPTLIVVRLKRSSAFDDLEAMGLTFEEEEEKVQERLVGVSHPGHTPKS